MDQNFIKFLIVIGLIVSLAACRPHAIAEPETTDPATSQVPASETGIPAPSPLPPPSEASVDFDCQRVSEIPSGECAALVALFESTDGANWKEHPGWLEVDAPCNWYGVTCEAGHVTELVLFDNGLSGPWPH